MTEDNENKPVAVSVDSYNQTCIEECQETLRTNGGGVTLEQTPASYIVRRLTPTECERLMGYPDGHTLPKFKEITEDLVVEFVHIHNKFNEITGNKAVKTRKQVRKWLEKINDPAQCSDSPRYKACGNGWAINCARWVLLGVHRFLEEQDANLK